MKEIKTKKVRFKEQMELALKKFHIGTGRIAFMRIISQNLINPFYVEEGRKKFLEAHYSHIQENIQLFPDLLDMKAQYGEREAFWRWARGIKNKGKALIFQQLVVITIAIFEAFISEVLLIVFTREPKCLCCDKQVTWEEVIKSGDSIIYDLATKKTDEVMSGDWEKIVNEFRKVLKIDLSDKIDTKSIKEIFEIRHAIVHNVGRTDEMLMKKIKLSEWGIKYNIGKDIVITEKLFGPMLISIEDAVLHIDKKVVEKFG